METIKCILSRRSHRAYLAKKVEKEKLEKIIECARFAPSAINNQERHFSVVSNELWLNKMSEIIAKHLNRESYHVSYHAPTLILVSSKKDREFYIKDASCALENIFLSATDLGLGSCWINQLSIDDLYSDKKFLNLLKEAGVKEDYKVYGAAAIGYPVSEVLPKERKENSVTYLD